MNLRDFQVACRRTAKTTKDPAEALGYFALGLAGEALEVLGCVAHGGDNVIEELGDCAFYVAASADALGYELSEARVSWNPHETALQSAIDLACEAGVFAEHAKKVWGHGHPLARRSADMVHALDAAMDEIAQLAATYGRDLAAVLEGNVRKLERRYPQGFSTAASLARKDQEDG